MVLTLLSSLSHPSNSITLLLKPPLLLLCLFLVLLLSLLLPYIRSTLSLSLSLIPSLSQGQHFSGGTPKIYLLGNPLVFWGNLGALGLYLFTRLYSAYMCKRGYLEPGSAGMEGTVVVMVVVVDYVCVWKFRVFLSLVSVLVVFV